MFAFLLCCLSSSHGFQVVAYHGVDDCYTIDGKTVSEHVTIAKPLGNCAIITDSQFVGIHSIFDNGGAILFSSPALNSSVYCARTVFTDCSTDMRGGAVYAKVMDLSMLQVCVFNCSAKIEGQFAFLAQTGGHSEMNQTSVVSCFCATGETVIHVETTAVHIGNLNCSNNKLSQGCGGVRLSSQYVEVRNCEIVGCSGDSVLRLSSKANLFDVTHVNVVGNTCKSGAVSFGGGQWSVSQFVFVSNTEKCFVRENSAGSLVVINSVFDVRPADVEGVTYSGCLFDVSTETYDICHMDTQLCPAVHTCTASAEPTEAGNVPAWSRSEVVGTLVGGMAGFMILGTVLGIFFSRLRRRTLDEHVSSAKLLSE